MLRLLIALAVLLVPAIGHAQVKVVIDAGHGGSDPGGVGTGMQEKNVVLDVTNRFKALLAADTADTRGGGTWTALLTRSNDTFVSLAGRSAYSNNQGADRFMSIHANAFGDTSANGIETFSLAATGTSAQLRNLVQAEMVSAWALTNRGNKTANFAVLRDTAAPAVLHELAFITNPTDAAKLGSPVERQKAAVAHLRAIQRHYNIAPYVPGNPPPQDDTGEIAGLVVDSAGPVLGATVKLEGGATVVTGSDGRFVIAEAAAGMQTLTASADGYATQTVEVTVASAAREEIEIVLVREGVGDAPDDVNGEATGGCTTGRGAGLGLVFALAALFTRRRRA
ncbi:MAG: N-acetylmuramoyl-L-alanine amidase [Deltaproteobacteria bacterium]|nr:N-acetylmuramoyl-L-alanine amidase [Deltaproteobacteria bacterium]